MKKHMVLFRLSAMGDVAILVPVIRALVASYPDLEITVVSRPFFKPFFEGIPHVQFFGVDVKKRHKGVLGLWRLFRDLNKLSIDYFVDCHNVLRSQFIRFCFNWKGVPTAALDKGRADKKALTRTEHKVFKPLKTMVENHLTTLKQVGFTIDLNKAEFPSIPQLAPELFQYTGLKDCFWIGIAPFAQYDSKVYPLDLMQEVIDVLSERERSKIFLFGGGEREIAMLNQLKRDNYNVVVIAGKVKLGAELNLIQQLDLMVSMDSGNAHLAAMYGKKVVTLWGATHPYAGFAPFNQPDDYCLVADRNQYPLLPTSVYGNKKVAGYEDVMRSIEPATVVTKIIEVLHQTENETKD